MKKYSDHLYIIILMSCIAGLALFLLFTNPEQVSIGLLVVPVLLFFFIMFSALQATMLGLKTLAAKPRKRRTVALVGASLVTVVMILQSSGGISGVDTILMALIVLVSVVYINKF